MAETYQAFYINEVRDLQLTIHDQDGASFAPSAAAVNIKNENGTTVVAASAAVSENVVTKNIDTTVTGTAGDYKVIWQIKKDGNTYYHVTKLEVQEW
jgi:hypothetical protein